MFSKTKIALCVAITFGLGAATALANDKDDYSGGFVIEGSMDGVNPVHHPDIFGQPAKSSAAAAHAQATVDQLHKKLPRH
jgi:hypothetical protein